MERKKCVSVGWSRNMKHHRPKSAHQHRWLVKSWTHNNSNNTIQCDWLLFSVLRERESNVFVTRWKSHTNLMIWSCIPYMHSPHANWLNVAGITIWYGNTMAQRKVPVFGIFVFYFFWCIISFSMRWINICNHKCIFMFIPHLNAIRSLGTETETDERRKRERVCGWVEDGIVEIHI